MAPGMYRWIFWNAVAMLVATACSMAIARVWPAIVIICISSSVLLISGYPGIRHLTPPGGAANLVTLCRLLLLIFALLTYSTTGILWFVMIVVLVMILDGVDGYLARRLGQSTVVGEIFDMEVDTFLAIGLSLRICIDHPVSWWVMTAAILRYCFVILYRYLGWQEKVRPAMPEAKVIAVVYFCTLLTPFVFGWDRVQWIVAAGCLLVAMSFLREFWLIHGSPKS